MLYNFPGLNDLDYWNLKLKLTLEYTLVTS